MDTCVDFRSPLFKPFLSEEAQVNPGCYGAELAWWLSRELAERGVETSYPNYEDWGWFVEYAVDDNEYWLCCGNVTGESDSWRIYLECKARGLFGRNKAPEEGAAPLLETLSALLAASPDVHDVQWSRDAY